MRFSKTDNIYKIVRITGSQDNILAISFGQDDIEVIEWNFNNSDKSRILKLAPAICYNYTQIKTVIGYWKKYNCNCRTNG